MHQDHNLLRLCAFDGSHNKGAFNDSVYSNILTKEFRITNQHSKIIIESISSLKTLGLVDMTLIHNTESPERGNFQDSGRMQRDSESNINLNQNT